MSCDQGAFSGLRTIGEPSKSMRIKDMDSSREYNRLSTSTSTSASVLPQGYSRNEALDASRLNTSIDSSSLLGPEESYHRELEKLLVKSRGTPYEAAMLKFFQSKMGSSGSEAHYSLGDRQLPSYGDDGGHSEKRNRSSKSPVAKQRERIEALSRPLPRHAPPPPPKVTAYTPTNCIGRQRPPPNLEMDGAVTRRVSLREFNSWLKRNERWKQDCDQAIQEEHERESRSFRSDSSPRLNSKSEVLANRARSRECSRSRVSLDASLEPERNRRSRSRSRSNRAHFSTDSKAPMPPLSDAIATESKKSPDAKRSRPEAAFRQNISLLSNQESFQSSHVFDRLAARSREYALRMRSQSNERPQFSFSPEITTRSRKILADKQRSWSRDPDTRLLSPARPQEAPKQSTSPLQLSPSKASAVKETRKRKSVSPDRSYASNRSGEHIARSMSAGRQRRASVVASWEMTNDYQPKLSAPKTQKILQMKNRGYQERLNRSVETFHLQKQLSEIIGEPGPGSYGGSVIAGRSKSSRSKRQQSNNHHA